MPRYRQALVRRFLELAPELDRIRASRVEEIESAALSIGVDYSKEPSGGASIPAAQSVVERLEADRVLKTVRRLKALFERVWPLIHHDHARFIKLHVWDGHTDLEYLRERMGGELSRVERMKTSCLSDVWLAMEKTLICTGVEPDQLLQGLAGD